MVGSEKQQYFVHKSLLAAKSPFFRTLFKKCWDGDNEEINLAQIPGDGFGIVMDWMYSGLLPEKDVILRTDQYKQSTSVLHAYKAADILMVDQFQNELISKEASILIKEQMSYNCLRLRALHDADLCHTKYYKFILKSATKRLMSGFPNSSRQWDEQIDSVKDKPEILTDILMSVRQWSQNPWKDFPNGDLTEFFVDHAE